MQSEISLVNLFLNDVTHLNVSGLKLVCSDKVQYHNPLMGYLHSEQVHYLWEYYIKDGIQYSQFQNPEELGDGYYKVRANLVHKTIQNRKYHQPVQLHIRLEDKKITEYSEAFSLHKMAQIYSPFWGWLLGWNRYYQNNMKVKARKKLFDLMSQQ